MHLLPRERDKLTLRQTGLTAQARLARGLRLNETEAIALIATVLQEKAREGQLGVSELMEHGRALLGFSHVLPGIAQVIKDVHIEATFPDGTFLVAVGNPICTPSGDLEAALHGSGLTVPPANLFPTLTAPEGPVPGEVRVRDVNEKVVIFPNYQRVAAEMTNTGDRPIQIGSHFPLAKVNPAMLFSLDDVAPYKLDIPAGTALRFEPGETKAVRLVETGKTYVARHKDRAASDASASSCNEPLTLTRPTYATLYGPTVGDRVRLADTHLWAVVEKDYAMYGDECTFGGGKVLRDGMGQSSGRSVDEVLDTVVTNALIIDYTGIIKADIGIKDGRIAGIGKAGNPDTMAFVTPGMIVGAGTEVIAAEHLIVVAGALDSHVHFLAPHMCEEALASGITTLIGGGTGPAAGSRATTCTSGAWHTRAMLRATDTMALNVLLTGKGNDSQPLALQQQIEAGCAGLKIHEDWGATCDVIDNCLAVCDEYDVQCTIHTDSLNETSFVEGTLDAIHGRTIHTYHSEGAGGGHAPDIMRVCSEPHVLPSSTNPTRPYAKNTLDEHLDMLMVCHHLSKNIAEDVAFADSRIRAETIAAEDVLHDTGAISMMSSDSLAMGRIGEVVSRTWRTADKMKQQRGPLRIGDMEDAADNDNLRIKRYVAKYTINPAIAHGVSKHVGSIEVGKLADLVLYRPQHFGVRPEMVVKGGQIALANLGDPNGSIPTVQPMVLRPAWGMSPAGAQDNSLAFVSKASLPKGTSPSSPSAQVRSRQESRRRGRMPRPRQEGHEVERRAADAHGASRNVRTSTHAQLPRPCERRANHHRAVHDRPHGRPHWRVLGCASAPRLRHAAARRPSTTPARRRAARTRARPAHALAPPPPRRARTARRPTRAAARHSPPLWARGAPHTVSRAQRHARTGETRQSCRSDRAAPRPPARSAPAPRRAGTARATPAPWHLPPVPRQCSAAQARASKPGIPRSAFQTHAVACTARPR